MGVTSLSTPYRWIIKALFAGGSFGSALGGRYVLIYLIKILFNVVNHCQA